VILYMKPSRIILVAILLIAILDCWLSVFLLQRERVRVANKRIIFHPSLAAAPTYATVTGILSDTNFRVALHALEQRTGVETLAEPEVVVTSSSHAVNRMHYDQRFTFYITNR